MNDAGPPWLLLLVVAAGVFALGVHGLRGLLAIRAAVRAANLDELANPPHWRVTRAFAGTCAALPLLLLQPTLGAVAYVAALIVGGLGYLVAPQFLDSVRLRVEREVLDHLTLHLDVMALAVESGSSLPAALALAVEHGPPGALQRAFEGVLVDVHAGTEMLDALRALDQRLQTALVQHAGKRVALRRKARNTARAHPAERATQSAANRFARAERLARAAPLKLWATLVLCIAPCTLVVLAFPIARLLALIVGRG